MIMFVLTVLVVFLILVLNEWWWHGKKHGEASRKFVHLTVGSFVAFWPLFLSWTQIELLSVAFIVVVLASQQFGIFKAIHSVQRPTYGEIYFGIAVGLVAFLTHNPAIYAAALLHMSVADGLAAIVGVRYGRRSAYRVFGSKKSIAGSVAFMIVSAAIVTAYALHQGLGFHPAFVGLVLGATLLENIAVRGLDNVAVPVLLAVVLRQIS